MRSIVPTFLFSLMICTWASAQPIPAKPQVTPPKKPVAPAPPDPNRTIPPTGKPLPEADRAELEAGVKKLGEAIASLQKELAQKPALLALLPDVEIYYNAVRYPLQYGEPIELKAARQALVDADDRIAQLRSGEVRWINATGPRGYVSRIDGSVQPYVVLIPANYKAGDPAFYRADFWCHGRGENLMELVFLKSKFDHAPANAFVVNLYGRYCCANKFAGEVDCLEVIEDLKKRYPIDSNKLVSIGFSMGGAAVWQFATHYSDVFAAASPGAGFSETREFLRMKPEEIAATPAWQKSLWHWYDCTDYAENLAMIPTIAYAGEIDGQKQASDVMIPYLEKEGLKLERLIGPQTGHKYEPATKKALDARLEELTAKGRNPVPLKIRFTTWTLRYNRMYWVTLTGLEKHWDRARVEASIDGPGAISVKTQNVTGFVIDLPAGSIAAPATSKMGVVTIDGKPLQVELTNDGHLTAQFRRTADGWAMGMWLADNGKTATPVRFPPDKTPGMQGPIDDAFMDAFMFVEPSGKTGNAAVDQWVASEFKHAVDHWRKQFRGEARVKKDVNVTEDDLLKYNVVCFGDASTNSLLAKMAGKLPVKQEKGELTLAGKSFDAKTHVAVLIYPNPLISGRYVVMNSGFTFREFDYENNARQIAKLPDFAVIDVTAPITKKSPGNVVHAGFFDEHWQAPAATLATPAAASGK